MTNEEIKALIDKYHLVRRGENKVGTYHTKGIDRDIFIQEVGAHKAEILAYFEAEEKAAVELREKRRKTFESIPGVAELRQARSQRAEWQREFNRMMETGDGVMRHVDAPTLEELTALESRYPMAVFALEAEYRARATENYQLSAIWNKTYDALCDGAAPDEVKSVHDAEMDRFVTEHIWD